MAPEEDIMNAAKRFFQRLRKEPEAKKELKKLDMRFMFEIEGSKPFAVEVKNGEVTFHEQAFPYNRYTDLKVFTNAKTLLDILAGRTSFPEAWEKGEIFVQGWKAKVTGFAWMMGLIRLAQNVS